MKICLVTFLYEPTIGGGAAAAVKMLARWLVQQGHSVTVLTSARVRGVQTGWDGSVKLLSFYPPNLYWVADKDRQPGWKKMLWQILDTWNPLVYRTVRDLVKADSPDVVHVHKLRGFSPAVWSAARAAGVSRLVHTCHDFEVVSPQGVLLGQTGELARRQAWPLRPYQALRRAASRSVRAVSAPSQFTLDLQTRMGFFPQALKRVIPNSHGLTASELQAQARVLGLATGETRILYLGRLAEEKGVALLCRVFDGIDAARLGLWLDVAGSGPLEAELRGKYGHNAHIIFHGQVSGEEKEALLRNCDWLVAPSLCEESFGISIVEAFAYGKPVLAAAHGAFPELVISGLTGELFDPVNSAALASALENFTVQNTDKYRPGCLNAAGKYTVEAVMQAIVNLYGEISV